MTGDEGGQVNCASPQLLAQPVQVSMQPCTPCWQGLPMDVPQFKVTQ